MSLVLLGLWDQSYGAKYFEQINLLMSNLKTIPSNISKIAFNQIIPAGFSASFIKGGQIYPVRSKKHVILSM